MKDQEIHREVVVQTLLKALELRNKDTAGHSYRMSTLALQVGRHLELTEDDLASLRTAALLHDIGKIAIPDYILFKPGSLIDDEWSIMKKHPIWGADIIRAVPELQNIVPIILSHHERWDGTGYPSCLRGEDIPLLARICGIVEVLDSLMSDCIYRKAWPIAQAMQLIKSQSGKMFDPSIVGIVLKFPLGS